MRHDNSGRSNLSSPMRHYQTDNGGHYAVAPEASGLGVLVQIMEGWEFNKHELRGLMPQARELLTTDEARALAGALLDCAMSVENKRKQHEHKNN